MVSRVFTYLTTLQRADYAARGNHSQYAELLSAGERVALLDREMNNLNLP